MLKGRNAVVPGPMSGIGLGIARLASPSASAAEMWPPWASAPASGRG